MKFSDSFIPIPSAGPSCGVDDKNSEKLVIF